MNVNTFEISRSEAAIKVKEYHLLKKSQRREEDDVLETLYRACLRGTTKILELNHAFRQTGLNEQGEPRLAIARADWTRVYFHRTAWHSKNLEDFYAFTPDEWFNSRKMRENVYLPRDVFRYSQLTSKGIYSAVPHIPPRLRPRFALSNYHILFEVEKWNQYPVDPFLLRRVPGTTLYVVHAEWELTELEASLLSAFTIK
jgi:hypothetical protein